MTEFVVSKVHSLCGVAIEIAGRFVATGPTNLPPPDVLNAGAAVRCHVHAGPTDPPPLNLGWYNNFAWRYAMQRRAHAKGMDGCVHH